MHDDQNISGGERIHRAAAGGWCRRQVAVDGQDTSTAFADPAIDLPLEFGQFGIHTFEEFDLLHDSFRGRFQGERMSFFVSSVGRMVLDEMMSRRRAS